MLTIHEASQETDTLSVCPSCVEQLENYGDICAVEAAGNLEVLRGGHMCLVTRLQPTRALLQQEIGRKNARGDFLRHGTRKLGAPVERATAEE